ncbi:hypothetical protein [Rhizobium alvei]|uniref:Lipoprotein n=1 Tax=Rhizobium alvei TaxID=1132659 RepID=A0ABT8YHN4_9HYPH|nr:hypothetical protein [Rhizobium alvei]MDO6963104.1 hypothetical protein [Rhizobium alvei]
MLRLVTRVVLFCMLALSLAACAAKPKRMVALEVYDIRDVTVTANGGVSHKLLTGIKSQMDQAIAATVRPVPLPRVVMTVRIVGTTLAQGIDGVRGQSEVSVMLSEVTSGHPVEVRNFQIFGFANNLRSADIALADAIASRLRMEYKLAIAPIRTLATEPAPVLSTRMRSDKIDIEPEAKPVVVPLKTAPVIGADKDPMLNSRTKVEPAKEPAAIAPVEKKAEQPKASEENALESGAKAKVVIMPKPATESTPEKKPADVAPAADEPCVETLEKKC